MNKIRYILPTILATITGKPRYFPEVTWSYFWTHNIFRVYECLFGRRIGIKPEMSTWVGCDENGHIKTFYACHSFESVVALTEAKVREALHDLLSFKINLPYKIYIPALQTTNGFTLNTSPYLFAIAYDAPSGVPTAASGNPSPVSASVTCTGSNLVLFSAHSGNQGPTTTLTSLVRNSINSSQAGVIKDGTGTGVNTYLMYQFNPSTGTYNLTVTMSSSLGVVGACSYSGVSDTALDGTSTTTPATTTSFSQNVTVTASDCWVIATSRLSSGALPSGSGGSAVRINPEVSFVGGGPLWDSGGTVGTGTVTITATSTNQYWGGGVAASFAPAGPTTSIKTINGLAIASVKTVNGLSTASVKTVNGLA